MGKRGKGGRRDKRWGIKREERSRDEEGTRRTRRRRKSHSTFIVLCFRENIFLIFRRECSKNSRRQTQRRRYSGKAERGEEKSYGEKRSRSTQEEEGGKYMPRKEERERGRSALSSSKRTIFIFEMVIARGWR